MNYIAVGAIALGIVILVIVIVVGWHADSRNEIGGWPPSLPEPPTFRVVALGLDGAGKTVLLSSLFHALNFRSGSRPYHLEAAATQAASLASVYARLIDTSLEWPTATHLAYKRDFQFDYVSYDHAQRRRTILRMNYLDYAGEILQPDQQDKGRLVELEADIKGAHALLGLIDGIRVRQLLLRDPEAVSYFNAVLLPMIGFMQRASCPIQLVVTKWDAVCELDGPVPVDDRQRFQEVKDALMGIPQIRALGGASIDRKLRLIPVSAVGTHFAELGGGGKPAKRADGRLLPINVDVPLCAVLPDLLRQVERTLEEPLRRRLSAYARGRLREDVRSLVALLLHSPGGAVLRGVDGAVVFLEWMIDRTPARRRGTRSSVSDPELRRLRGEAIKHMEKKVEVLEIMWQESVC